MEAKPIFKPKMQIVSFHKIDDVDDFQFDNDCPDNNNPNIAFTVWAPSEFDGTNLVKVSDLKKQIEWLKEELHKMDDRPQYNKLRVHYIIDEVFSFGKVKRSEKETNRNLTN